MFVRFLTSELYSSFNEPELPLLNHKGGMEPVETVVDSLEEVASPNSEVWTNTVHHIPVEFMVCNNLLLEHVESLG